MVTRGRQTERMEGGMAGRMHPVSLRTETLQPPWGRGSGSRLPGSMSASHAPLRPCWSGL
ncbi:hypothetical protein AGMMS4952_02630 [Spirochaetia bacterium]|nr:hypothetical protein AGMMS4952_02630 [Spirochaetia bacterium]